MRERETERAKKDWTESQFVILYFKKTVLSQVFTQIFSPQFCFCFLNFFSTHFHKINQQIWKLKQTKLRSWSREKENKSFEAKFRKFRSLCKASIVEFATLTGDALIVPEKKLTNMYFFHLIRRRRFFLLLLPSQRTYFCPASQMALLGFFPSTLCQGRDLNSCQQNLHLKEGP